jgi:uncharacterized membrane protein YraQ (UPF0718 family)
MLEPVLKISQFIAEAFLHIWPYVIVTIPLAVAVQMSGASKYIKRAFEARPLTAVVLATVLGAFSPFCSCGVIPVIASLLISGVPLAPVMSFWIASPSMDPEIFFLSVGMIGWELAVWRLAATLVLSLGAGFITHMLMENGWLGQQILRTPKVTKVESIAELFKKGWQALKNRFALVAPAEHSFPAAIAQSRGPLQYAPVLAPLKSESTTTRKAGGLDFTAIGGKRQGREVPQIFENNAVETVDSRAKHPVWKTQSAAGCSSCSTTIIPSESPPPARIEILNTPTPESSCSSGTQNCGCNSAIDTFWQRLLKETLSATAMVIKFMALAFFLEALIILYVPQEWITAALGRNNPMAIATAAVLGVPAYTSSLAALPMISGLMTQGMNPAAALAFLIAGPTTTLPAMAAVWPLVARRVFVLYVSFALVGAIIIGYLKLAFG